MLMRMIYDDRLAQAAYLIGCQRTGEAIVIDPERDVDRYIRIAESEGLTITAAAETHIHADFLSGSRELAERLGATVYLSDEGDADWKYRWVDKKRGGGTYRHRLLQDGDTFNVGNIEFRVVHTPGHTPEHICFLVTDRGADADEPMGMATGDFVFVGDLGRPDLLETAAGAADAKEPAAHALFHSARKFDQMPDYLQVWPGHGAGSACGKALGAVPQSTVGYEKRFNPAIRAASDEDGFVKFILSGQPEPPMYFARMKRDNKEGPAVLGELPHPKLLNGADLKGVDGFDAAIIDTRPWRAFRNGHAPGALHAPLDKMFLSVVGSYVEPKTPIYLIIEESRLEEAVRSLVRIGLDRVVGHMNPSEMEEFAAAGGNLVTTPEIDVAETRSRMGASTEFFLDVRGASEFERGHIPDATNIAYTRLPGRIDELPRDRRLIINCQAGGRSARACSYLQRAGFDVANVKGGYGRWQQAQQEALAL